MNFLEGLSEDIKKNLLEQLRVLWTHTSTAIEGNTLSLGETAFVLSEGLTISGKPLKDHRDVEGHARAIDAIYYIVKKSEVTATDLFDLHRLVISEHILDVYKPVGNWKNENNSTTITINEKLTAIEFSNFWEVPQLMEKWLALLNSEMRPPKDRQDVIKSYARLHMSFVCIHPFYDGNGRIARLVSNLPCLKAGFPPVIIPKEKRYDYIMALAEYQFTHGVPAPDAELVHEGPLLERFTAFCEQNWRASMELVEQAHAMQLKREENKARNGHH
jgi:Fic family protein